ncbi:hypothetical protein Tco_0134627 [Tanacetum coccineum]
MPPSFVNPDAVEETSTDPIPPPLTKKVQEINSQTTTKVNQEGYVNCPKSYELKLPYPERRNVEKRQDKDKVQLQNNAITTRSGGTRGDSHHNCDVNVRYIMNKVPRSSEDRENFLSIKLEMKTLIYSYDTEIAMFLPHPMGIAKDVVVRVDGFTFLADFVGGYFADELAPLDSLPPGNDDSTLKKDLHEENFQENVEIKNSNISDEPVFLNTPLSDKVECFAPEDNNDEIDDFLAMEVSSNLEEGYFDSEGDIAFLDNLLSDDDSYNLASEVISDHEPEQNESSITFSPRSDPLHYLSSR